MLRVCIAGTMDTSFHRNRLVIDLLERTGCELDFRLVRFWGERGDRIVREGKLRLGLRAALLLPVVVCRFIRAPKPDVLLVGYPGHLDMLVLGPIAKLRRVPIVFDAFLSLFDTVVSDRKLLPPRSISGRILAAIDRWACRLADLSVVDTPAHATFFSDLSRLPEDRFRVLWVGAEERLFHPRDEEPEPGRVLFYGTYIPLHGVATIIEAAKLLQGEAVRFRVIGSGQQRLEIGRLVQELRLDNVDLAEPLPLERLPDEIAKAVLCLGIFGDSDKAFRVIPNKVFQALAMGRPVITADTPAMRAAFKADEVVMVPATDPAAQASSILALVKDQERARELAFRGHARYLRDYSQQTLAGRLRLLLKEAAELSPASRRVG